jgi:glycosyltransferase involved in cell wall biosynthesis
VASDDDVSPHVRCFNEDPQMTPKPLISICITNYNYARYLPLAIDSALAQTYPNTEIIVVDDASTDNSMEVLDYYRSNPKITIYRNENNVTIAPNHNIAAHYASGEYISFLSADDILLPTFLDRSHEVFERFAGSKYELGLVMTDRDNLDAGGTRTHFVPFYPGSFVCKGDKQAKVAMMGNPGAPSLWLVKANALQSIGGFNPIYGTAHDWEFLFRMCCFFDFGYLNEKLCLYRWHHNLSIASMTNLKYICTIHVMKMDMAARVATHPYLSQFADIAIKRTSSNAVKFAVETLRTGNYEAARKHLLLAQVFDSEVQNTPVYKALHYTLNSGFENPQKIFEQLQEHIGMQSRTKPYDYPDDAERF